jgi:hypothetical protein
LLALQIFEVLILIPLLRVVDPDRPNFGLVNFPPHLLLFMVQHIDSVRHFGLLHFHLLQALFFFNHLFVIIASITKHT